LRLPQLYIKPYSPSHGFDEQISGRDEQDPGRGQSYEGTFGPLSLIGEIMRVLLALLSTLLFFTTLDNADARGTGGGIVSVRGHTTTKGTYVAPHFRTGPNSTRIDNWSTRGNVNPFTGKAGTK